MLLRKFLTSLRCLLDDREFRKSVERNRHAAHGLDRAVKEVLGQ